MSERNAPSSPPSPLACELLRVLSIPMLAWAGIQVLWFLRTNVALFHQGKERPFGVFSGLLSTDWSFSLANTPPVQFACAVAMAGLTTALGMLLVRCCGVYLRLHTALALGFLVGLGASGIAFELLTMAKALYLPVVWLAWFSMIAAAAVFVAGQRRRPLARWWWRKPADESVLVPELDIPGKIRRDRIAYVGLTRHETGAMHLSEKFFWGIGFALVALMTLAIFWHALFFPESYWDSLILYLGYARMTFLEHAFPEKVVAQVGIGLGANYPHLFSTYGAVASTMFGQWSDLHQRLAAPLASLAATVLVYDGVVLATGRKWPAMAAAVLFRSVPLGIAYATYASDYAVAIAFVAAFLYLAAVLGRMRTPGALALFSFIPAAAMHVNYLMGILWVPWVIAVLCALRGFSRRVVVHEEKEDFAAVSFDYLDVAAVDGAESAPAASEAKGRADGIALEAGDLTALWRALLSWRFVAIVAACMALGSPWYIRNWIVTGNPVYAFYPNIFTASKNVNPDVLKSAELEWFRNGDGIGRLAEQYADIDAERQFRDQGADDFRRESSVWNRFQATWLYWQGFETFRQPKKRDEDIRRGLWLDRLCYLADWDDFAPTRPQSLKIPGKNVASTLHWSHAYKTAPLVLGFTVAGAAFAALMMLGIRSCRMAGLVADTGNALPAFACASLATLACLLAYHYLVADLYLYQIAPFLVPAAIIGAMPFLAWRRLTSAVETPLTWGGGLLIIVVGIAPGLAMSLMNFKVPGGGMVDGRRYDALALDVFRHPGMDEETFYTLRFGADAEMWRHVNRVARGEALLTHDNRHLMYDPSIELVQLDDWDVQQVWDAPRAEKLAFFEKRGIRHYLRIPNERNHPINARAGMDDLIAAGDLVSVRKFGENELFRFRYAGEAEP